MVSDQHWPDEVEATSNSAWCDRPSFSASTNASATPIIEIPRIMLLQILAACPAPASPQCTLLRPIRARTGSARAKASALPPAMKVRVAAVAPPTPPETGASRPARPRAAALSWAARALATSMVEQSISRAPGAAAGRISS